MSEKFRIGDRVVRVTSSRVPEGIYGTVLGKGWGFDEEKWEVEYDDFPCLDAGRIEVFPLAKSKTSWLSREEAIELSRDEVRRREMEKERT